MMKLDVLIRVHTLRALKLNNYNRRRTAFELGICVRSLRDWISKWRDMGIYIPAPTAKEQKRFREEQRELFAKRLAEKKASMDGSKNLPMDGQVQGPGASSPPGPSTQGGT